MREALLAHIHARLDENSRLQHALAKEVPVLRRAATRLRVGVSPALVLAEVHAQGVAIDRPSVTIRPPLTRPA